MKSKLKTEYIRKFNELRSIINTWELIPGSPLDEFDSINHLLLGHLHKESDEFKISKAIQFELTNNYGLDVEHTASKKMTIEVLNWWITSSK